MKRGGIAQLVERLLCKQDVSGSNPLTSTKKQREKRKGINSALSSLRRKKRNEDAGVIDSSIEP